MPKITTTDGQTQDVMPGQARLLVASGAATYAAGSEPPQIPAVPAHPATVPSPVPQQPATSPNAPAPGSEPAPAPDKPATRRTRAARKAGAARKATTKRTH